MGKRWRKQLELRKEMVREQVLLCQSTNNAMHATLVDADEQFRDAEECSAALELQWGGLRTGALELAGQSAREHETVHIEIVQPAC